MEKKSGKNCKSEKEKKTLKQELSKTINFGVKPKMANRKFVEEKKVVSEKKLTSGDLQMTFKMFCNNCLLHVLSFR